MLPPGGMPEIGSVSFLGFSATIASVVVISPAIEAASCSAHFRGGPDHWDPAMTPFWGIGANTALRDAAALRRALVAVAHGQVDPIQALAAYERDMIGYGFAAVQMSLKDMERFHAKGHLARAATKSLFRVIR